MSCNPQGPGRLKLAAQRPGSPKSPTRRGGCSQLVGALIVGALIGCEPGPGEDHGRDAVAVLGDTSPDATRADTTDAGSPEGASDADAEPQPPDADPPDIPSNTCPVARVVCAVRGDVDGSDDGLVAPPLSFVECTGAESFDDDGEIVAYRWTVTEAPAGSAVSLAPDDGVEAAAYIDLTGRYELQLTVVDDAGCASAPTPFVVVGRYVTDLFVEVVWSTPEAVEPEGPFGEVALHVLHPNGCWGDSRWDCSAANADPDWGEAGRLTDDPSLVADERQQWFSLDGVESPATYRVAVEYVDDRGLGESLVTVRIFVFDALVFEVRDVALERSGDWWEVAAVAWPSTELTALDRSHGDVPECAP